MKSIIRFLLLITISYACSTKNNTHVEVKKYSHDVGDIVFDSATDDPKFRLCDSTQIVTSRRALSYAGSRTSLSKVILNRFRFQEAFKSFDGYIVIRFLVNCDNETDRFRVETIDAGFAFKECPNALTDHLMDIVKGLDQWGRNDERYESFDCVKFINFKIVNGKISDVLQ